MSLYKDTNNNIHDDADGFALTLPSWPIGCLLVTDEEAEAIRQSMIIPPTYQELRLAEYPPISNYIDGVVKGNATQVQTYIDACLAVKAKFPKS